MRKDLVEINPTASNFKGILEKARKHEVRCMDYSFEYYKHKWDKSHVAPDFKVEDCGLVSTTNLNNIKVLKKPRDSFSGHSFIKALNRKNSFEVELSEELSNKHPKFTPRLIKP
ncbi:hypothetical protein O181_021403 [Austropuccinia psidii MF-1]|uniref:Uncharacterized protein n=1 Tax=Austropuccinia psidii MF-1 TaxID=1389203 RepID=A0A9Q3GVE5_9BASI|nr:hypothetical protein [Austropuccinia psidii MF-1]